jgi:phosphoribosyl 1,2-cyclic phosphate phosphodiesterase
VEWNGVSILIDTATDLRQQALRAGIRRIDAVLYTHAHADHVLGLDELRLYNWRQRGPVPIFGSAQTLDALSRIFWYVFEDDLDQGTRPAIDRHIVDGPFDLAGREIVPVPLIHGLLPILGYRIGSFAYLTDVSRIPKDSYSLLRDLDVLVLNALRERAHATHLTLSAAVEEAERIGAARTWLTHMSHEVDHLRASAALPPGVELAYDGLSVRVADGTDPDG